MIGNDTILKINPSIDIYKIGDDQLEFYYIMNRRRITMEVTPAVISLINDIDGQTTLQDICNSNDIDIDGEDLQAFLSYLVQNKILIIPSEEYQQKQLLSKEDLERYDRQINYFNTSFQDSGYFLQHKISETNIVIFGLGAIGSGIALQLVMAGVRRFTLIDKDIVTSDNIERHFVYRKEDDGLPKVRAVEKALKGVDSKVKCRCYNQIVDYDTNLTEIIKGADLIINTLDEPYIGFTSMKIGRLCYKLNKPLYVGGGFDAHLMSTGELIIPNVTPCVDCYTTYFTNSLKDWKPKYNVEAINDKEYSENIFEVGGLSSMSLFSISYAVIVIITYICTGNANYSKGRGELLFDNLNINYLNVPRDPNCKICGQK